MLSLHDLATSVGRSQPTIRKLYSHNAQFQEVVKANRVRQSHGYEYTQAVLNWLIQYYHVDVPPASAEPSSALDRPSDPSPTISSEDSTQTLQVKIQALQSQIDTLHAELAAMTRERDLWESQCSKWESQCNRLHDEHQALAQSNLALTVKALAVPNNQSQVKQNFLTRLFHRNRSSADDHVDV